MSDFNENNNQNDISENISSESTETSSAAENSSMNDNSNVSEMSFTNGPEIVSGVETVKKNPKKIIAVIAAAVILIFGCCAGAYAFVPQVKNTVKMLVNSPEEYFKWVETENIKLGVDSISEYLYGEKENKDYSGDMRIDLEKEAIEALIKEQSSNSTELQEINIPSTINMNVRSAEVDGYRAMAGELTVDGKHLLSDNVYLKDSKYYIQYPDFSSSYLGFDIIETFKASIDEEGDEEAAEIFLPILESLSGNSEKELLSRDEFEKFVNKYSEIVINNINNVELEKDSKCEADGVECEYTKLIAKFDQGTVFSILKDFLKEIQNDETIIGIIEEYSEFSKEDYSSAIGGLLDQIGGLEISGGQTVFVMNVYVNNKGEIVGTTIDNIGYTDPTEELGFADEFSIGCVSAKNDNNYGFSLFAEVDDERYSIDGSAVENSRKLTGEASVSADGEKAFGITFNDLEQDGDFVKGSVTLGLSALGADDLTINFDEQSNKQIMNFDFTYEGKKYFTFTYEILMEKPDSVIGFDESAKVYSMDEMEEFMEEWNVEEYLKNIADIFGVDESYFTRGNMLMNNLNNPDILDVDESNYFIDDEEVDEFTQEDWEDIEGVSFEDYSITYDLSKIKIQYNGSDIKLPGKISGIYDTVKFDSDKIAANDVAYGYSDDYGTMVGVFNMNNSERNVKDCDISYISVTEDSGNKLTIDGIGIGDDIQKAVDKYGCKLSDPKDGYTEMMSDDRYSDITIYYYDGKIYEISAYFGE